LRRCATLVTLGRGLGGQAVIGDRMEDVVGAARCFVAAALLGLLAGCTVPGIRVRDLPQPTVRSSWAHAGIRDDRVAFATGFCAQLESLDPASGPCAQWLWRLPESTGHEGSVVPKPAPDRRTLVIIPGILGECVAPWVTPFSADYRALEALGYRVHVIPVKGRASSQLNARIIHEALTGLDLDDAVVVAYSKGVTDFMSAATLPEAANWRDRLGAFISVAGTANGSPAANHSAGLYQSLLRRLPFKYCQPSDGGGVQSLSYADARDVADRFAASKPGFALYSIIAVAADGPVNPVLRDFHALLARIDERNDGQVLLDDAVVPGSTVLGVFRADHWSIALPFEDSDALAMRPLSRNNHFPRGALIRAALEYVAPVARNAQGAESAPGVTTVP